MSAKCRICKCTDDTRGGVCYRCALEAEKREKLRKRAKKKQAKKAPHPKGGFR